MKKFLTFVLCFCIMFTFSVGVSFAAVTSTTYQSEAVKNAVESVCAVDYTKYPISKKTEIQDKINELRNLADDKENLDAQVLTKIDELKDFLAVRTLAYQETELNKIKADTIVHFNNNLDAYMASKNWTDKQIALGEKVEFEADVKAVSDWFTKKRLYCYLNTINGGHDGNPELTLTTATSDVQQFNLNIEDFKTWFNDIANKLDNVKNLKEKADKYYIGLSYDHPNTYSAKAIDIAKAQSYTAIELLAIVDPNPIFIEPMNLTEEASQKAEADVKALTDAKNVAILAITTGDYYIGNWSGKSKDSVNDIQNKYTGYINAAATIVRVDEYKAEAIKLISQYKTDAQIKEENDKNKEDLDKTKEELEAVKKELALSKVMNNFSIKAKSSKTSKGYIKVRPIANTEELTNLGYTVKYKFYRATSKAGPYKYKFTSEKNYINTAGKKGKTYYYKVKVIVYDAEDNIIAETKLKNCKYAYRKFSK